MNAANRDAPGKRATGYVCARSNPTLDSSAVTPANDVDPINALIHRYNERINAHAMAVLRDLLSEVASLQRRPRTSRSRHVVAPQDMEPVDQLARARAKQLLSRCGAQRYAKRSR